MAARRSSTRTKRPRRRVPGGSAPSRPRALARHARRCAVGARSPRDAASQRVHRAATFATPFELLVATILSAQSHRRARQPWSRPRSSRAIRTPRRSRRAEPEELEPQIQLDRVLPDEVAQPRRHGARGRRAPRRRRSGGHGRARRRCPASDARPPTSCSGTRSACRACPSIVTCCASSIGIGLVRSDDPVIVEARAHERAAAGTLDARLGHAHPARPAHLPAEARSAIAARCDRPARTSARSAPKKAAPAPSRRSVREGGRDDARRSSASSSTRRSRPSRRTSATRCRTSPSSSRTSRRRGSSQKSTSSRRTRCSACIEGTPLTERQWAHGNVLPDKITLFQGPIEDASEDEDDVVVAIGETLIHEIGHYFGLSEEEIEEIEERYWRGDETTKTKTKTPRTMRRERRPERHVPRKRFGQHFLAAAWAAEGRGGHSARAGRRVPRDWPGHRRAHAAARGNRRADPRRRDRSRSRRETWRAAVPPNVTVLTGDFLHVDVLPLLERPAAAASGRRARPLRSSGGGSASSATFRTTSRRR